MEYDIPPAKTEKASHSPTSNTTRQDSVYNSPSSDSWEPLPQSDMSPGRAAEIQLQTVEIPIARRNETGSIEKEKQWTILNTYMFMKRKKNQKVEFRQMNPIV